MTDDDLMETLTTNVAVSEPSWPQLISMARSGDSSAMNEVLQRIQPDLRQLVEAELGPMLRAKLDPADIVQQSLLDAYRDFGTFRGTSESEVRSWLIRVVKNNLYDTCRRFCKTQQRDVSREISLSLACMKASLPSNDLTASHMLRRKERVDELRFAVGMLSKRCQHLLRLRYEQGLSHSEIAGRLGMSEAAVRKQWSRAIQELRNQLQRTTVADRGVAPAKHR